MVQTHQPPLRVYKYPFELVMLAYERRFPKCDLMPMFVGSEVLSEESSEDGSTWRVMRRCTVDVDVPRILKSLAGMDYIYFIHRVVLNRRERTFHIRAHNETFSNRLAITEDCWYSVHPENEDWTCFEQIGSLDIKSFFGFETVVEKIALKQYAHSISQGNEIIDIHRKELEEEGITYVPRWTPSSPPRAPLTRAPPTRPPPFRRPPARPPPIRPPPVRRPPTGLSTGPPNTTDPLPASAEHSATQDAAGEVCASQADGPTENAEGWLIWGVCWLCRGLGWLYSGVDWLQWWRLKTHLFRSHLSP